MPAKIHHYSDDEVKKFAPFWFSLYKSKMPHFNKEEIMKLIYHHRCPPWRFPATMWYFGKLTAIRIEKEKLESLKGRKVSMEEAQISVEIEMEAQYERSKAMQKIADDPSDPLVWSYKVLKPQRKKGVTRLV